MTAPLEHLIFSTRAARPKSGTELSREVIAWSPGAGEEIKSAFGLRADIAGTVLHQRELRPVYTFSRLDRDVWLFCRAVSLGLYRKGSHQLLIHGVVLRGEHLDWLEGNPFLLDHPEIGLGFRDEHPGSRQALEPLRLEPTVAGTSRRLNLTRLETLSRELATIDDSFPALFEGARAGRRTACIARERPDSRLLEWLLLHLHPADRAETSFHTWYTHSRALDYQLLLVSPEDAQLVRRQFPGIALWPDGVAVSEEESVGGLCQRLRRESPRRYLEALTRYHATARAAGKLPPLPDAETRIWLRHELGLELAPKEAEVLEILRHRGTSSLNFHVHELARTWRDDGIAEYVARLESLVARPEGLVEELGAEQVEEAHTTLAGGDQPARWALAVIVQAGLADDESRQEMLRDGWYRLFPPERFQDLLGFLGAARELVGPAEGHLVRYAVRAARYEALVEKREGEPSYWPALLRWLAVYGGDFGALLSRVEHVADEADDRIALAWFRLLQEAAFALGYQGPAYRLVFQKEAPRLDESAYPEHVRRGVHRLLDDAGSPAKVLRSSLGEPRSVREMLAGMSEWILAQDDPEAAWKRWRDVFEEQEQALCPEVEPCGELLAALASSALATHVSDALALLVASLVPDAPSEPFHDAILRGAAARLIPRARAAENPQTSPHLPRGIAGLLRSRRSEGDAAVDEALLELVFHGLIHADHVADRVAFGTLEALPELEVDCRQLRRALESLLDELLAEGRFLGLLPADGPWADLLLDELLRWPSARAAEDPRYRAFLTLAWRRWSLQGEREDLSLYRIQRMLSPSRAAAQPPPVWHRKLISEAVPPDLHREAEQALDAL